MQQGLRRLMVAEQGVPIHPVQLTGGGRGRPRAGGGRWGLQTEQAVKPRFDRVVGAVTDGLFEFYLWGGGMREIIY